MNQGVIYFYDTSLLWCSGYKSCIFGKIEVSIWTSKAGMLSEMFLSVCGLKQSALCYGWIWTEIDISQLLLEVSQIEFKKVSDFLDTDSRSQTDKLDAQTLDPHKVFFFFTSWTTSKEPRIILIITLSFLMHSLIVNLTHLFLKSIYSVPSTRGLSHTIIRVYRVGELFQAVGSELWKWI